MSDSGEYWKTSDPAPSESPQPPVEPVVEPVKAPRRSRAGFFSDPVVRAMAWLAGLLVVTYLATIVGALLLGVLGNPVPRTAVEQRLTISRAEIEAGSKDPVVWSQYIDALIDAGQYQRAETMIERAVKARYEDPTRQYFGLARASLDLSRKRYADAIRDADAAMKALTAQRDKAVAQFKKDQKPKPMSTGDLGENYYRLVQVKAEALEKLGRKQEAVAALDTYLLRYPRAADILEWRGDIKLALGDAKGALADYKEASKYVPDDAGLKKKITETGAGK